MDRKTASTWQVAADVPSDQAWDFEALLAERGAGTGLSFAEAEDRLWHLHGVFAEPPDLAALLVAFAALAEAHGVAVPDLRLAEVPDRDWLAASYRGFPPIDAGRFHVRGSHVGEPPPRGRWVLTIDAATAFGTGEHASTRGCLLALDRLARRAPPRRVLDMGCGSGILGLAAARAFGARVLASDIDPEAARVTVRNARINRLAARVRAIAGNGYGQRIIKRGGPYDAILSNILARPLCRMAHDLGRYLAPGGAAVLAGFLARDANRVLAAHRGQGLRLLRRINVGTWTTLILVKPGC